MAERKWKGGGAPDNGAWDQANNWVGAAIPVDVDSVVFLAGDWVADPTSGPSVPVSLLSIADDAGFSAAGGDNDPVICYADIRVLEVAILSACTISGGDVGNATLSGNGGRITGGTFGSVTTDGAVAAITGGASIGTLYLNGAGDYADHADLVVTTAYLVGDGTYLDEGTYGTVYMQEASAAPEIRDACDGITTLWVYSVDAEVSGLILAAGLVANGPYLMTRDIEMLDSDNGNLIANTLSIRPYGEGEW